MANHQQLDDYLAGSSYLGSETGVTLLDYRYCSAIQPASLNADVMPHLFRWHEHVSVVMARYPHAAIPRGRAPILNQDEPDMRFFYQFVVIEDSERPQRPYFHQVRTLADINHGWEGKVRLCRRNGNELVVVKQIPKSVVQNLMANRERSRRREVVQEDPLNEIGAMVYLADRPHDNVIKMLDYFHHNTNTELVFEPGGEELFVWLSLRLQAWRTTTTKLPLVQNFVKQILQGTAHLHHHSVGHRDISLENLLIQPNIDPFRSCIKLMDFGMAVRSRVDDVRPYRYYRYFAPAGKHRYRPPEANLQGPRGGEWLGPGYFVEPFDLFSCGVCAFVLSTGIDVPWEHTRWDNTAFIDPWFNWVFQCQAHGVAWIPAMLHRRQQPALADEAVAFIEALLRINPERRLPMVQALRSDWMVNAP